MTTTYRAAEGFHPGEFLREELEERGWSQLDFAAITGQPPKTINEIIKEKRSISVPLAIAFSQALGSSAEYWLRLQTLFDIWKAEADKDQANDISRRAELYRFPVREMARRGWIDEGSGVAVLEQELRRFYETDSLCSLPIAAKRSNQDEPLSNQQIAWLYRMKHLAAAMRDVSSYSKTKLRSALASLCELRGSAEDVRRVAPTLAAAGVRFLVVERLPSLKLDGVCFWIGEAPVVGLSLRYDRIDHFWFVLRHEIEHVLNGDAKGDSIAQVVPDSVETTMGQASHGDRPELLANTAASDFCVPREHLDEFQSRNRGPLSRAKIAAFAQHIGVHPGLVVGQLHHRGVLPYENLRAYLVKVRSHVAESAVVDGWGVLPQLG